MEDLSTADGKSTVAHVEKEVKNTLRKVKGVETTAERIGPHILVEKL